MSVFKSDLCYVRKKLEMLCFLNGPSVRRSLFDRNGVSIFPFPWAKSFRRTLLSIVAFYLVSNVE